MPKRPRNAPECLDMVVSPSSTTFVPTIPFNSFAHVDKTWKMGFSNKNGLKNFRLFSKGKWESTRWADAYTMEKLGIDADVATLCTRIGIKSFFDAEDYTYVALTSEFLATWKSNVNANPPVCEFQLRGTLHQMTIAKLGDLLGLKPVEGGISKTSRRKSHMRARDDFWRLITRLRGTFRTGRESSLKIRNPVIRYFAQILSNSLFPSKETHHIVSACALQLIHDALNDSPHTVDLPLALASHFDKIVDKQPTTVSCGGIVSIIARCLGHEVSDLEHLDANIKLDASYLLMVVRELNYWLVTITNKRALQVPNTPRTTILTRHNWEMPLGPREYKKVMRSEKDTEGYWECAHYDLEEDKPTFD